MYVRLYTEADHAGFILKMNARKMSQWYISREDAERKEGNFEL